MHAWLSDCCDSTVRPGPGWLHRLHHRQDTRGLCFGGTLCFGGCESPRQCVGELRLGRLLSLCVPLFVASFSLGFLNTTFQTQQLGCCCAAGSLSAARCCARSLPWVCRLATTGRYNTPHLAPQPPQGHVDWPACKSLWLVGNLAPHGLLLASTVGPYPLCIWCVFVAAGLCSYHVQTQARAVLATLRHDLQGEGKCVHVRLRMCVGVVDICVVGLALAREAHITLWDACSFHNTPRLKVATVADGCCCASSHGCCVQGASSLLLVIVFTKAFSQLAGRSHMEEVLSSACIRGGELC
jgi:hypothetical protein